MKEITWEYRDGVIAIRQSVGDLEYCKLYFNDLFIAEFCRCDRITSGSYPNYKIVAEETVELYGSWANSTAL